jgi:hypothetical protein
MAVLFDAETEILAEVQVLLPDPQDLAVHVLSPFTHRLRRLFRLLQLPFILRDLSGEMTGLHAQPQRRELLGFLKLRNRDRDSFLRHVHGLHRHVGFVSNIPNTLRPMESKNQEENPFFSLVLWCGFRVLIIKERYGAFRFCEGGSIGDTWLLVGQMMNIFKRGARVHGAHQAVAVLLGTGLRDHWLNATSLRPVSRTWGYQRDKSQGLIINALVRLGGFGY